VLGFENINQIKNPYMKELVYMFIAFLFLLFVFAITFNNNSFIISLKTVFSLFWLFILPGFYLLSIYKKEFSFIERLFVGTILGAIVMSLLGYYIGVLFRLNIKYYPYFLPEIFIILGILLDYKDSNKIPNSSNIIKEHSKVTPLNEKTNEDELDEKHKENSSQNSDKKTPEEELKISETRREEV